MAKPRAATVSVEDFGPIKRGRVTLKPLTVFIGPNNSGKSYMALLVYALTHALRGPRAPGEVPPQWELELLWNLPAEYPRTAYRDLAARIRRSRSGREVDLRFGDLPPDIQSDLTEAIHQSAHSIEPALDITFRDYFGYDGPANLARSESLGKGFTIGLGNQRERSGLLGLELQSDELIARWAIPDLSSLRLAFGDQDFWMEPMQPDESFRGFLIWGYWRELLQANGVPMGNAYYLPSARSGILQGSQVLASMAVSLVRSRAGLDTIEMPAFTGVPGDFLHVLLERVFASRSAEPHPKMGPALEVLEGSIFRGEVSVRQPGSDRSLMSYKTRALDIPVHRASSMVAELAPLDLWIKYLLRPGDLLIIDQPEAELHPANQRLIARVLVRLVRAGVQVICPTHSSLILHQVSNHLLASEVDADSRQELGFTDDDLLNPDEVAVYLYDLDKDGTVIRPVKIEPGFGISEEEFVRVSEAIGDESYRLTSARPSP